MEEKRDHKIDRGIRLGEIAVRILVGWTLVCIKFILLVTILFGIQYFITKLAWDKSNKIQ
ncbi:hypothetical protein BAC7755_37600 [Bacillus sp. MN7755]